MTLQEIIALYCEDADALSHSFIAKLILKNEASVDISHRTLRRKVGEYRSSEETAEDLILDQTKEGSTEDLLDIEYSANYHFDQDQDLYIFFLAGFNKPISLTGHVVRELKRMYSDWDGNPATINEICRSQGISRKVFTRIKQVLSWTHDSEPFTDEEIVTRSEGELLEDLVQQRKFALEQRFQKSNFKKTQKDALNWQAFKEHSLNPFEDLFKTAHDTYQPKTLTKGTSNMYAVVLSPFDFHYGKYGWSKEVGYDYNRKIAKELLLEKTQEILEDIKDFPLERFIVPVGSDYFHIDTFKSTTTAGTPQDCDGTVVQMLHEGSWLMIEFIDLLRSVAPVEIMLCAGNHDSLLSNALLLFLQGYYRGSSDVEISGDFQSRQYIRYGSSTLGFTHGDGPKADDLCLLMVNESKQNVCNTDYRYWFTGHLHFETVKDLKGTKFYQMPSLSGSDRWHHKKGYQGSTRGMCAYLVHKEKGVKHNIFANI